MRMVKQPDKRPASRETTAAVPGEVPELPSPLQRIPRVRCSRCGTLRVGRVGAYPGTNFVYYECKGEPLCVDRETGKAFRFKIQKT